MAKIFRNGKWVEGGKVEVIAPKKTSAKVFKDGKWVEGETVVVQEVALGNPRDTAPIPPAPPTSDADRPRWVSENVAYLEKLSEHRSHLAFKAEHPELRGKGWNP
jgi:hypothetical protein